MDKLFESKIIDELFEIREEDFKSRYIEKNGNLEERKKAEKAEEELVQFMKKYIKNEKEMAQLFSKINKFEGDVLDEMCFWHKPYYKLGFIDGILLKRQIKEESIVFENSEKSIIHKYMTDILEFAYDQKYKNLQSSKEYNDVIKKIKEIEKKYPKVETFFVDEQIDDFTPEELKAILKVIILNDEREALEENEMFKIGLKEGKVL